MPSLVSYFNNKCDVWLLKMCKRMAGIIRLRVKLSISFIIENTSIEVKCKKLMETNVVADLTIVEKTRLKVWEKMG